MKKLITLLVVLAGVTFGIKYLIAANNAAEENHLLGQALYHEKNYRFDGVVTKAIETLETRLESIEKKTGIKSPSFLIEERQMPLVFRYRLGNPLLPFVNRSHQGLLNEISSVLNKVVPFEHVVKAYPAARQAELLQHYTGVRYQDTEKYAEINLAATEDLRAISLTQSEEMQKIDSLTVADVPEYQIAWQREFNTKK